MSRPPNFLRFLLLLVVSVAVEWHSIVRTVQLALHDSAYTHILIIVPLSCAIIYFERRRLTWAVSGSIQLGVGSLIVATATAGLARWLPGLSEDLRLSLSMIALVVWAIGSLISCFGMRTFRALLFPLCFLFWIVPLPVAVLDEVIYFLQYRSAVVARIMFIVVGVPVSQDGILLSLPTVDLEVARECSSIRSSMLLLITAMIMAHLFLKSWWRKALLIAAVIPLAAIKNGFRIFTITELATRVDPSYFDGNLHHRGGILFLAIAFVVMCALLWGLRRTETGGLHSN